jgi:hypothetical protein
VLPVIVVQFPQIPAYLAATIMVQKVRDRTSDSVLGRPGNVGEGGGFRESLGGLVFRGVLLGCRFGGFVRGGSFLGCCIKLFWWLFWLALGTCALRRFSYVE